MSWRKINNELTINLDAVVALRGTSVGTVDPGVEAVLANGETIQLIEGLPYDDGATGEESVRRYIDWLLFREPPADLYG